MFNFVVKQRLHKARHSELQTPHGTVAGPFFQFVATNAAIRGMVFSEDLAKMNGAIVLANTYHLYLEPGPEIVAAAGGLHGFMQWDRPITTDSGGYQVFSLGDPTSSRFAGRSGAQSSVKLTADSVTFRSPRDGAYHALTPEKVIEIQQQLGADLIMPLDVCTPFEASREEIEKAVEQTSAWARRCSAYAKATANKQALYGIVQGGLHPDLREKSAVLAREIGFFGYAIGGEMREGPEKKMVEGVQMTVPHLPLDAPRYLMGAGAPEDIVAAVREGIDQFDCVLPIRNARHGQIYRDLNEAELEAVLQDPERPIDRKKLYSVADMHQAKWAKDFNVFSPGHPVIERSYTNAYVRHLLRSEAPSGLRLMVLHNIFFYAKLMRKIQAIIEKYGK